MSQNVETVDERYHHLLVEKAPLSPALNVVFFNNCSKLFLNVGMRGNERRARPNQTLLSVQSKLYNPYPFWSMPKICHSKECVRLGRFNK
jgi:hypothetical protein